MARANDSVMLLAQQVGSMAFLNKLTVFLLLGAVSASDNAWAQGWTEYKPADSGYRVELPGAPKIITRDAPTQIGQIKTTMAFIERGPEVFVVSHNDYPMSIKGTPIEQVLDGVRNGQVGTNKLRSEEKIQISGNPGRHLVIETAQ